MNVAISAMSAHSGAGPTVLATLVPELAACDKQNTYVVFYGPAQRHIVDALPRTIARVLCPHIPGNALLRIAWEQIVYPLLLAYHRIDLLYSVGNTTSIVAPCPVVLLMENANPYSHLALPWSRGEQMRLRLLRVLGWLSARRARAIRFVSARSRDLILPRLGVDSKKCVVIP